MPILPSLALETLILLKSKVLPIVERKYISCCLLFPFKKMTYNIYYHLGTLLGIKIIIMIYITNRSATSKLTMENVPWHADVKAFSEALAEKSNGDYEIACEHVHSCCVLLAKVDKFKINGQWHTWIDYDKFHDLVGSFVISFKI